MNPVTTLADAISQIESTNPAYNNPGAISGTGNTGQSFGAGIGVYSDLASGEAALQHQLDLVYSGSDSLYPGGSQMTLQQFGEVYAPNQNYGASLASTLGVSSATPLSSITPYSGTSWTPFMQGTISKQITNPVSSLFGGNPISGLASQVENYIAANAVNFVTVIVGLILIAAGLFAFKQTQTIITTVGGHVRRGAELATTALAA